MIHSFLLVQSTCMSVLFHNLSTSWSGTLYFTLHTFLHPIIIFFHNKYPHHHSKINGTNFQTLPERYSINSVQHTHTHPFNGPLSGITQVSWYQKVKPIWNLLKQETVSGRGISWAICKSAPRSRQITMPAPHHSVFLQAGCPSCHPNQQCQSTEVQLLIT